MLETFQNQIHPFEKSVGRYVSPRLRAVPEVPRVVARSCEVIAEVSGEIPWFSQSVKGDHAENEDRVLVVPKLTGITSIVKKTFYWKWGGSTVQIAGTFSDWIPMRMTKEGSSTFWSVTLPLTPGYYEYKFIVDGHWGYSMNKPIVLDSNGNVNNKITIKVMDVSYYAVYDGHAGSYAVDYVKENLHLNIQKALLYRWGQLEDYDDEEETEEDDIVWAIRKGFKETENRVISESRRRKDVSGTCVCAAMLVNNSNLYIANLGDCSAVVMQYRPETIRFTSSFVLSTIHRPKTEQQRIVNAGGWVNCEGYIIGELSCSRSLGDREFKFLEDLKERGLFTLLERPSTAGCRASSSTIVSTVPTVPLVASVNTTVVTCPPRLAIKEPTRPSFLPYQLVSPEPSIDLFCVSLTQGLMVIASDGLWDLVPPNRAMSLVDAAYAKSKKLEDVVKVLIEESKRKGCLDDITVLVFPLPASVKFTDCNKQQQH